MRFTTYVGARRKDSTVTDAQLVADMLMPTFRAAAAGHADELLTSVHLRWEEPGEVEVEVVVDEETGYLGMPVPRFRLRFSGHVVPIVGPKAGREEP